MEQRNEQTKIIFSKKVLLQLMEMGFRPIETMQNPTDPHYLCWVFARTDEFNKALDVVLGGMRDA